MLEAALENIQDPDWLEILKAAAEKSSLQKLFSFLDDRQLTGATLLPHPNNWLNAFELCSYSDLKVIILGQDPYHGPNQAHGLAFSVPDGVKIPPSLRNIIKELQLDIGKTKLLTGNLESWAKQGVLLLNAVLSVEPQKPGAHANIGWETFTDEIIKSLSTQKENLVFILWGAYAQKKTELIDAEKHLILKSAHPSPLSAYNGFFGSKPFSKANAYLDKIGKGGIEW